MAPPSGCHGGRIGIPCAILCAHSFRNIPERQTKRKN
jgi:hypothetical protein